jgi:aldehyde:ferredoxin oxidoreductase
MLSGSVAAMSGRISVGCKSPLTGGIKEANSGGQPSQMLGRLGYAAIVLEGKPKKTHSIKSSSTKTGWILRKTTVYACSATMTWSTR